MLGIPPELLAELEGSAPPAFVGGGGEDEADEETEATSRPARGEVFAV
jgi:hypothetical protein